MSFIGDLFSNKPDYAGMARNKEKKREKLITQGSTAIDQAYGGFDPSFYQGREQAYINYAMPQLAQQYRDVSAPLGFNLANRNLMGGSVARKQYGDLTRTMGQGKQQIADTAVAQSQALQQQVLGQKNTLLSNLYASADPANAQQQAIATAAGFAGPSVFAPISNMFGNLLNAWSAQQAFNAYRPSTAVQTLSPYSGLYGGALPSTYNSVTNR